MLLELKGEFKSVTGKEWKPGMVVEEKPVASTAAAPVASSPPTSGGAAGEAIKAQIDAQGRNRCFRLVETDCACLELDSS